MKALDQEYEKKSRRLFITKKINQITQITQQSMELKIKEKDERFWSLYMYSLKELAEIILDYLRQPCAVI